MRLARIALVALAVVFAPAAFAADKLTIAAAADLKFCLDEIVAGFRQAHAGDDVDVVYGSSGNFKTQIEQGAPFDLYFSADIAYPRELARAGRVASEVQPYAIGRLVLWSASMDAGTMRITDLARADIRRIAIANPQHAPYGKRAEEALRASGVWERIEGKLVYGENIAQTAQFVQSGNAQIGIIALSLAMSPQMKGKGSYSLVPENLHQPLEQGFVLTKRGGANALATAFAGYMRTPAAREVMVRYGFVLPGETGRH
ncbi:MAG TPA: molybdate ABC transporter substrate-binding protein [Rudaea sp.]|nr:molybdate ABC transporter substrate-binding protein [Rudaea sp.]